MTAGSAFATRRKRRAQAVAVAIACGLGLSACAGNDPGEASSASELASMESSEFQAQTTAQQEVQQRYNSLPQRPPGTVAIDGATGSLTNQAIESQAGGSNVTQGASGTESAFASLCAGEIDLVDSARSINDAELEDCKANGLDVVQFQIASDAIVLAIKSESDVGGDCLSTPQVRDIFRAGSPVGRWSDAPVGLMDVKLEAAGPSPTNNAFGFFAATVLSSAQPALVDFRSDYQAFDSEDAARRFVFGDPRDRRRGEDSQVRASKLETVKNLLGGAQSTLEGALAEQKEAQRQKEKGIQDNRVPADQAKDQERLDRANEAVGRARAERDRLQAKLKVTKKRYRDAEQARNRYQGAEGNVAFFRFPYYGAHEDQLRPFEITLPDGQIDCIFPSQRTIVNGRYPLSRQLLMTTTVRSLERREVQDFMTSYLENSANLATAAGLVPLPEQLVEQQQTWITDDQRPLVGAPDAGVPQDPQGESELDEPAEDKPVL